MALTEEQKKLRKEIYQRLADHALEPSNPLYEPLYEHPGCEDPVSLLQDHIELSGEQSFQLFSGFRGSGKTTELRRLRQRLERAGFLVLYADTLEYLNPSEAIDISDFLIALGGAFNDALLDHNVFTNNPIELAQNTYWQRIANFLQNTTVDIREANLKSSVTGPLSAGVDLKLELKTSPTFRQNVQRFLSSRIGELRNEAHRFFEDGVKAIRTSFDEDKQVVFIFDSFEQLRGSVSNEGAVLASVEQIFADHLGSLMIPHVHFVLTVPPWMKFTRPWQRYMQANDDILVMLRSISLWRNDADRSLSEPGCQLTCRILRRRFEDEGTKAFFGTDERQSKSAMEKLAKASGGNIRCLLRLAKEAVLRANCFPVSDELLESAVMSVRNEFLPIAIDDAQRLTQIAVRRNCVLQNNSAVEVHHVSRLLDTNCVLYFSDGDGNEWYDVHPLIRDDVLRLSER